MMRRKIFSIATLPTINELFDCSADSQLISAVGSIATSRVRCVASKRISPSSTLDAAFLHEARHHGMREFADGEGIGQKSDSIYPPDAGQGELGR